MSSRPLRKTTREQTLKRAKEAEERYLQSRKEYLEQYRELTPIVNSTLLKERKENLLLKEKKLPLKTIVKPRLIIN